MPVLYKLHKDTRMYSKKVYTDETKTQIDTEKSVKNPNYKKWNARAVHVATIGINELAEQIEQSTTLTKADIKACIEQLIVTVRNELLNSKVVKLDGFGSFKAGIRTSYADTMDDFSVSANVIGSKVNFQPAFTVNSTTNERTVALLKGIKVKETPKNANL